MAHELMIVYGSPLVEHSAAVAVPLNPALQARVTSQVGTVKTDSPAKSTPAIPVVGRAQVTTAHELMIVYGSPLVEHSAAVAVPLNPALQARVTSQVAKLGPVVV